MSPLIHAQIGWLIAAPLPEKKHRVAITVAAVIPDLDGFGLLIDESYYEMWHHKLAHGFMAALLLPLITYVWSKDRKVTFLVFLAFHSHILADLAGSGPGWPIFYLWPLNTEGWLPSWQWDLASWQNSLFGLCSTLLCLYCAIPFKRTPVEIFSANTDQKIVQTIRNRFVSTSLLSLLGLPTLLLTLGIFSGCTLLFGITDAGIDADPDAGDNVVVDAGIDPTDAGNNTPNDAGNNEDDAGHDAGIQILGCLTSYDCGANEFCERDVINSTETVIQNICRSITDTEKFSSGIQEEPRWRVRDSPSFIVTGDFATGTALDTNTGLMWVRQSSSIFPDTPDQLPNRDMNYTNSLKYCHDLVLDGFDDWRLPTMQEVISMFDYTLAGRPTNPAIFLDNSRLFYWTSTRVVNSTTPELPTGDAWVFFEVDGDDFHTEIDVDSHVTRCVRQHTPSPVRPAQRFDARANTVIDRVTSLEWQRVLNRDGMTNAAANDFCNNLNFDGRVDWRLPTLKELISIHDVARKSPAVDQTIFQLPSNVEVAHVVWASTVNPNNTSNGWVVSYVFAGNMTISPLAGRAMVRCVRNF